MKIYTIRDRLIDYYLRPFAAEGDKEVMASLAEAINNEENQTPLAKAPHHFELWSVGTFHEDGTIEPEHILVADCGSLIRERVRRGEERGPGGSQIEEAARRIQRAPHGATRHQNSGDAPVQDKAHPAALKGERAQPADQRSPEGTDR